MDIDGWQDLDEYQREQSIAEGEVGPRQVGVAQEGDSEFEGRLGIESPAEDEEHEEAEAPKAKKVKTKHEGGVNASTSSKPMDKMARKKAKKEKLKEERKKRREQNLKAKEAEE